MKSLALVAVPIAAAAAAAALLRVLLIEPEAFAHRCGASAGPWWCTLRAAAIVVFASGGLAVAAIGAGVAATVTRRAGVALSAACLGAAGLVLYSVEAGAVALLLGLLALARARERESGGRTEQEA
jgi:hypothetical protein